VLEKIEVVVVFSLIIVINLNLVYISGYILVHNKLKFLEEYNTKNK